MDRRDMAPVTRKSQFSGLKDGDVPSSQPRQRTGFFDFDQAPDNCDMDIWDLTLYFVQKCEENRVTASKTNGRPIVYETLKNLLTKRTPAVILAHARSGGIHSNTVTWVLIVKHIIDTYFSNHNYDVSYVVDSFTSLVVFDYYLRYTVETLAREEVLSSSRWVAQPDREVKPSRRTEEEKRLAKIFLGKKTEEEVEEKKRAFKEKLAHQEAR